MLPRIQWPRHRATILAVAGLMIVIALPVLAASPSPSGGPGPKASHGPKGSEAPEVQVTITGQVGKTTDGKGRPTFTLTASGKTLRLEAGPPWFYTATNHPLLPFVGKTVTIVGEQSGDEIDVTSVDGKAIRPPGRPPWAGGWKEVGKIHPGWSQDKADRAAAKAAAKAARAAACAAASATPGAVPGNCHDGPDADESEAPESPEPSGG
jgi:hypothetical protein